MARQAGWFRGRLRHALSTTLISELLQPEENAEAAPRVLVAYERDYRGEIASVAAGTAPGHRLFGLTELMRQGWSVTTVRAAGEPGQRRWHYSQDRVVWRLALVAAAWASSTRGQVVFATTEASALPLLLARRLRLIDQPVVFVAIALTSTNQTTGLRYWLWRLAIVESQVILTYDRAQARAARKRFPRAEVRVIPFGVDVDWLGEGGPQPRHGSSVLSVGTNEGRDFGTLVAALPDDLFLTIVTDELNALKLRSVSERVRVRTAVPIEELRDLYHRASMLVLPLREAHQSSGQTVLLENMACGTPIIVSDVSSVRDYVIHGQSALVVPPGDAEALRWAITRLLSDPEIRQALGQNAKYAVRESWSSMRYGTSLAAILNEVKDETQLPRTDGH